MDCDKVIEELWPSRKPNDELDQELATRVSIDDWSFYLVKSENAVEIEKRLINGSAQDRLSLLVAALYQDKADIVEMLTNRHAYSKSQFFHIAKMFIDNREVEKFKFMLRKKMVELNVDLYEYIENDLNNWVGRTFDKAEWGFMEILKNAKRKAKIKSLEE